MHVKSIAESAILLTFTKLPFVFKIFLFCLFLGCRFIQVLLYFNSLVGITDEAPDTDSSRPSTSYYSPFSSIAVEGGCTIMHRQYPEGFNRINCHFQSDCSSLFTVATNTKTALPTERLIPPRPSWSCGFRYIKLRGGGRFADFAVYF